MAPVARRCPDSLRGACPKDGIIRAGSYSSRSRQERAQSIRASIRCRVFVRSTLVGGAEGGAGRHWQKQSVGCLALLKVGKVIVAQESGPSPGSFWDSMGMSPIPATAATAVGVNAEGGGNRWPAQIWMPILGTRFLVSPLHPQPLSQQVHTPWKTSRKCSIRGLVHFRTPSNCRRSSSICSRLESLGTLLCWLHSR
jgi:hypothetical protein